MVKLNLTIDEEVKEFEIPNSWNDVTIENFQGLSKLQKAGLNQLEFSVALVGLLTEIDSDTLDLMDLESFNEILKVLEFAKEPIEPTQKDSIVIDGIEYFIKKDFDKLNLGEMTTLNILSEKYKDNIDDCIPDMLCVFLRQKKENGKLEGFKNSFMERAEIFKANVKISDVHQLFLFFSNGESK